MREYFLRHFTFNQCCVLASVWRQPRSSLCLAVTFSLAPLAVLATPACIFHVCYDVYVISYVTFSLYNCCWHCLYACQLLVLTASEYTGMHFLNSTQRKMHIHFPPSQTFSCYLPKFKGLVLQWHWADQMCGFYYCLSSRSVTRLIHSLNLLTWCLAMHTLVFVYVDVVFLIRVAVTFAFWPFSPILQYNSHGAPAAPAAAGRKMIVYMLASAKSYSLCLTPSVWSCLSVTVWMDCSFQSTVQSANYFSSMYVMRWYFEFFFPFKKKQNVFSTI